MPAAMADNGSVAIFSADTSRPMRSPIMRLCLILFLVLFSAIVPADEKADESFVVARLLSVERAPFDCGVVAIGSVATYLVQEGLEHLKKAQIKVIVPCMDMPRTMYSRKAGDLEAFVPGQTHHLAISRRKTHELDAGPELPDDPSWFFLRAASLKALTTASDH